VNLVRSKWFSTLTIGSETRRNAESVAYGVELGAKKSMRRSRLRRHAMELEKDSDSDVQGRIEYHEKSTKSIKQGQRRECRMLKKDHQQERELNRDASASQPSLRP
jgi:hypothetical protein